MAPCRTASASSSAFPSDLYGKYKQATQFFLDWLLRARSVGVGANAHVAQKATPEDGVGLAVYQAIVAAIVREPTALSPSLLQLWPRALAACETAITLRARVALFFPSSNARATDSHTHFLERLRGWLKTLKEAETPVVTTSSARVEEEQRVDFSNYFSVLELPDDYFPVDIDEDKPASAGGVTTVADSAAEQKRIFDDAFENDLNVELSFLFMELEELSEAVYGAFLDIKLHKKTLVEATAVTKVAIDCAASVIAKVQLRFPAIRTAQDMMTLIQDRIPSDQLHRLLATVMTAWYPTPRPSQTPQSQYVPGTIVADMLWVSRALQSFVSMPIAPNAKLVLREGFFGEMYDEESTREYCMPNMIATPSFLMQQLALLYNTLLANRSSGIQHDTSSLSGWFLDQVDQFFTKRSASLHFVFLTICWVRSVSALQGEGGLGRTVSLSIMHRWGVEDRIRASIAHGEVLRADASLHKEMEDALENMQQLDKGNVLLRANPLLAGFMMLDCTFRMVHLGTESLLITSRFRAFGHIYNALRDRRLMHGIPLIEDMLQVYESTVFTPSRASATHGLYTRTYLVSSHMTEAAVDAMLQLRPAPPEHLASRVREFYHLPDLSRVYRLLKTKDYSVLPTVSATASWRTLLGAVSQLCTEELFESRVLSRDMLKFSDDMTDAFNSLCDTLGRRYHADQLLEQGIAGMPRQYVINRALEDVVVMPLLPFLDCLNRNGSIRVAEDAANMLQLDTAREMLLTLGGSGAIEAYCRRAAGVITTCFAQRDQGELEAAYFAFPSVPEWSVIEFGCASLHDDSRRMDRQKMFLMLLEMMEESEGPLLPNALQQFKTLIRFDPGILAIAAVESDTELCTLLHHAAAGPARDRLLLEWIMHAGGLHHQPKHCRQPPSWQTMASMGMQRSQFMNALAVHSAAKEGLIDVVRLLLEADQMRDLNTVTFHTRDSLAHIAVKNGHRNVYDLLHAMGADVRHKNAAGKFVYDLTSDPTWKRTIVEMAILQRRQEEKVQTQKSRDPQLRRESEAAAEQLRKELADQREVERLQSAKPGKRGNRHASATLEAGLSATPAPATGAGISPGGVSSSKSKKKSNNKKKTKHGKQASTGGQPASDVTNLMQQLVVGRGDDNAREPDSENESGGDDATANRVEKLRRALDVFKEGSLASSAERDASAKQALAIVDFLKKTMQHLALGNAKHDLLPKLREQIALEALQALFLLSKFNRQLPEELRSARERFWESKPDEATLSPFEKLVKRAGPSLDFSDFLAFSVHTARVLGVNARIAQTKEALDLLERRLLKMKLRSPVFRKYVEGYALARRRAGLEPVEGSTPQARRAFEWYQANYSGIDDSMAFVVIDQLYGFEWYLKLKHHQDMSSHAFTRFEDLVYDGDTGKPRDPCLRRIAFIANCIVVGSDLLEVLGRARELIVGMAETSGLQIVESDSECGTKKVSLVGFEFSATGIVREA